MLQAFLQDHPNGIIHRVKSGLLGGQMSGSMKVTFWRYRWWCSKLCDFVA